MKVSEFSICKSLPIWAFIFCILHFSCRDKNCPGVLEYHLPVSIAPLQDTFDIGDTLFLAINFPKKMIDKQAEIENVFENYDFRIEVSGSRYDIRHSVVSHIIDLTSQVGKDSLLSYSSFDIFRLNPNFDGNEYHYNGLLILQESGVFALSIYCFSDNRINPFEITGNCDHLNVHFYCDTNEGMDNNVELVKPYFVGNPDNWDNDFKKNGGFAFVVR